MVPYVVKQGDYLAKLAFLWGVDADDVWNAAENAALKALRKDPNVLAPGDILHRPNPAHAGLAVRTGGANKYVGRVAEMPIAIRLLDDRGKPSPAAACTIDGLGEPQHLSTDGNGVLHFRVPVTVRSVTVTVDASGYSFEASIGGLDPITEPSGRRMRLHNLGYIADAFADVEDDARLATALAAFQTEHGTGAGDPWEHVASVHGC